MIAETFWELLGDPGHWYFEVFLIALFDGLVGWLAWGKLIKPHIHRDVKEASRAADQHVDDDVQVLQRRLQRLEDSLRASGIEGLDGNWTVHQG